MSEDKPYTPYPADDILTNYDPTDTADKYAYLKGVYIFRYPFTLTAIKWGLALGSFFALHTYFKKKTAVRQSSGFSVEPCWPECRSGVFLCWNTLFIRSVYENLKRNNSLNSKNNNWSRVITPNKWI